jgi:lysophospholipase L1-like esterase
MIPKSVFRQRVFAVRTKSVRHLRAIIISCALLPSIVLSLPVILSQPVRDAYLLAIHRQIAKVIRPRFVFAGDSLMANRQWGWALAGNPLAAVNLAKSGATINQVAAQVSTASAYRADFLVVLAGTNDILLYNRPIDEIVCAYRLLLDEVPAGHRLIVTLIPNTSFLKYASNIEAANLEIKRLSEMKGANIIDINPILSTNGILNKGFTQDGIHFNEHAYRIWTDQIARYVNLPDTLNFDHRLSSVSE